MKYEQTLGRLVGVAHHMMIRKLDECFREEHIPITADQFKLMSRLWDQDGISQQDIADKIARNRAATGRMIDTLERNGMIQRQPHPTDRRLNLVFLTKEGRKIEQPAIKAGKKVVEQATLGLKEEEVEQMKEHLQRMIKNLR